MNHLSLKNPSDQQTQTQTLKILKRQLNKRQTRTKRYNKGHNKLYNKILYKKHKNKSTLYDILERKIGEQISPKLNEQLVDKIMSQPQSPNTPSMSTSVMILLYSHAAFFNVCYIPDDQSWYSLDRGHIPEYPFLLNMIAGSCKMSGNLCSAKKMQSAKDMKCIGDECDTLIDLSKKNVNIGKSKFGIKSKLHELLPLNEDDDEDIYMNLNSGMPNKDIGPNNFTTISSDEHSLDDLNICSIIGINTLTKSINDFFPENVFENDDFKHYCKYIFLQTIILERKQHLVYDDEILDVEINTKINITTSRHGNIQSEIISEILINDINIFDDIDMAEPFFDCIISFEPNENLFSGILLIMYQYLWNKNKDKEYEPIPFNNIIDEKVIHYDPLVDKKLSKKHIEYYEEFYNDIFDPSITDIDRVTISTGYVYTKENTSIIIPEWTWKGLRKGFVFYCAVLHEVDGKSLIGFQVSSSYKMATIVNFCDNPLGCYLIDATCSNTNHTFTLNDNELEPSSPKHYVETASDVLGGRKKRIQRKTRRNPRKNK
jgi:hypothetical protein